MSLSPIESQLAASEAFLSTLDALIKSQILASWPDQIPGIDPIARALDDLVVKAETALRNAENAIKTQIAPLIESAIPSALDFIGAITASLDTHLSQLISNIATTEDVLGAAIGELKKQSPHLAAWIYTNVAGSFGNVALGVLESLEHEAPDAINPILDELLAVKELPPWLHAAVAHARGRKAPVFAFILPAIILAALLPVLGALGDPIVQAARQGAWDGTPTKVAEPPTLLDALIRKSITLDHFRAEMRKSGFDSNVADLMLSNRSALLEPDVATRAYIRGDLDRSAWELELQRRGIDDDRAKTFWRAALTPLSETDAREAWLRGLMDDATHDATLAKLGYESTSAKLRRSLYFYIPPAQDLIHMAIRNVFNDEIVQRFELFGDFPDPFRIAAAQQGISELWAQRYWGAHWIVPSNTEGFEMFQRTTDESSDPNADTITLSDGTHVQNIIGGSTLKLLLREKDIAPFYRSKLTELAYHPLTRIDIRRLAALGLLTHAEVERAYLDLGYSQRNARRLADFVVALNKNARKTESAALVDNLKKQTLRLYVQGKLGDHEVDQTLADLNFSDAEVAVFKAEALLIARAERISRIEARVGKLYVSGIIDAPEAEKRLKDHDVPTGAITQLFSEWDLDIEYRAGSAEIHKQRDLTKSEILEALKDGMIDQSTAEAMLVHAGYDQNEADALIGLALFQQGKTARRAQVDAIKALFVNGISSELDTSNRLDSMRTPPEQRDALLAEWTLLRETRTERIPIATLRDMIKGKYLSAEDGFAHLKRHRFTDTDANLLLTFWGAQPAPKGLVNA